MALLPLGATPTHSFSAGTYEVALTVSDGELTATETVTITVTNTAPVADIVASVTDGLYPLEVSFDASGSSDAARGCSDVCVGFQGWHHLHGRVAHPYLYRWLLRRNADCQRRSLGRYSDRSDHCDQCCPRGFRLGLSHTGSGAPAPLTSMHRHPPTPMATP